MTERYDDFTIDEVMADPMIRTVMRADRVEPRQFESLLRGLAATSPRPSYALAPMGLAKTAALAKFASRCDARCDW